MNIPEQFIQMQQSVIPDLDLLLAALDSEGPTSIRINPFKPVEYDGASVDWAPLGRSLDLRPSFTSDVMFHGGGYYVQEASSMFLGWIMEHLELDRASTRILDLCAAPGGKTTHLAQFADIVVANEVIRSRARILVENVEKWGSGNIAVTSTDAANLGQLVDFFNVVVVDAPCSGEGMFRKDDTARREWSLEAVELCAQRGRRIVSDIWPALEDGGVMIYSTCTFNRQENELNLEWICRELGGEVIRFDSHQLPQGVVCSQEGGFRFYPHLVRGEGFFIAAIRKKGSAEPLKSNIKSRNRIASPEKQHIAELNRWVTRPLVYGQIGSTIFGFSEPLYSVIEPLRSVANLQYSGVVMGEMIRSDLKPAHSLAMYHDLNRDHVAVSEVEYSLAMSYLRKENLPNVEAFQKGLSLVCHRGLGLGWIKRIESRCNNQYPQSRRILKF